MLSKTVCMTLFVVLAMVLQGCEEKKHLCDGRPERDECQRCYDHVDHTREDSEKKDLQKLCATPEGRKEVYNHNMDIKWTYHERRIGKARREDLMSLRKPALSVIFSALEQQSLSFHADKTGKKLTGLTQDDHHDMSWYLP